MSRRLDNRRKKKYDPIAVEAFARYYPGKVLALLYGGQVFLALFIGVSLEFAGVPVTDIVFSERNQGVGQLMIWGGLALFFLIPVFFIPTRK